MPYMACKIYIFNKMIIINVNNNPTIAMQIPFVWLG